MKLRDTFIVAAAIVGAGWLIASAVRPTTPTAPIQRIEEKGRAVFERKMPLPQEVHPEPVTEGHRILGPGTVRPQGQADYEQINDRRDKKNWAAAIQLINQELARYPNHGDLFYLRGDCYRRQGETDLAINDFRQSLSVKEGAVLVFYATEDRKRALADVLYRRGAMAGNNKEYVRALSDLSEADQLNPRRVGIKAALASVYHNRGSDHSRKLEIDLAIADYTEAIGANPTSIKSFVQRGDEYARKSQHELAIVDYTDALRIDPNNHITLYSRGVSFDRMGEIDKAIADFSEAIRLHPADAASLHARGILYARKKDFKSAIADFTFAIDWDPQDPTYFGSRHDAYRAIGNNAAADADLASFRRLRGK